MLQSAERQLRSAMSGSPNARRQLPSSPLAQDCGHAWARCAKGAGAGADHLIFFFAFLGPWCLFAHEHDGHYKELKVWLTTDLLRVLGKGN